VDKLRTLLKKATVLAFARLSLAMACLSAPPLASLSFAEETPPSAVLKADPTKVPAPLREVGIEEHLGAQLNFEGLEFVDDRGQPALFSQYFNGKKPVLINLVYFECPMLCTLVLNGIVDSLKGLDLQVGRDFSVVTVSIDPKDTPVLAAEKKANYIDALGRPDAAEGWHFLTGKQAAISNLAKQLGFQYKYDGRDEEFAHPAVIFMATGKGVLSRYLYGAHYAARDMRFSIMEAGQGRVGTVIDRFLMFCFHYDPAQRGYVVHAIRVMQISGLVTLLVLGTFLGSFWIRQRRKFLNGKEQKAV
jgi:protein SCO1